MKQLFVSVFIIVAVAGVKAQSTKPEETRSEDVNIYTDPNRRIVKVVYYTNSSSDMKFSVVNEAGDTVLMSNEKVGKGEHSKLIDLGTYPKKSYRLVVENNRMKQEEPLMFN